jgi:hypothetical protein
MGSSHLERVCVAFHQLIHEPACVLLTISVKDKVNLKSTENMS